jgi:prepilin-type N-terminal cleavage/methylation domain-containing protein
MRNGPGSDPPRSKRSEPSESHAGTGSFAIRARESGFTLIEIVVAIALLSLLAGATAAVSVRVLRGNLGERTVVRLRAILTAMIGDPVRGDSGYLGDMGELPDTSLSQLFVRGAQPVASADAVDGILSGWNGAYILDGADPTRGFVDAWSSAIAYTPGTAQLTSRGPDRTLGTADDIIYPSVPPALTGAITILVKGQLTGGGPPVTLRSDEASILVYYTRASDNTRVSVSPTYTGAAGAGIWKTATALHKGDHGIIVTGLNASGAGGHDFSGSNARDIARVVQGPAFITVLLEEAG